MLIKIKSLDHGGIQVEVFAEIELDPGAPNAVGAKDGIQLCEGSLLGGLKARSILRSSRLQLESKDSLEVILKGAGEDLSENTIARLIVGLRQGAVNRAEISQIQSALMHLDGDVEFFGEE